MGYTTEFVGNFNLNKELDEATFSFLTQLNESRRVARTLPPEYGVEGEFYVEDQDDESNIIDYNRPPKTQPSLWCCWRPSEDRKAIEWDGQEKFYEYESWLAYILKNFLIPKGYTLSGAVHFQGEDLDDHGWLICDDIRVWISSYKPYWNK